MRYTFINSFVALLIIPFLMGISFSTADAAPEKLELNGLVPTLEVKTNNQSKSWMRNINKDADNTKTTLGEELEQIIAHIKDDDYIEFCAFKEDESPAVRAYDFVPRKTKVWWNRIVKLNKEEPIAYIAYMFAEVDVSHPDFGKDSCNYPLDVKLFTPSGGEAVSDFEDTFNVSLFKFIKGLTIGEVTSSL